MVLGPQAKNSNNGKTYIRKPFSKKIIQIFTKHLLKKKKSPNRGPTGIYTGFPLLSGTGCGGKQFFLVEATC